MHSTAPHSALTFYSPACLGFNSSTSYSAFKSKTTASRLVLGIDTFKALTEITQVVSKFYFVFYPDLEKKKIMLFLAVNHRNDFSI